VIVLAVFLGSCALTVFALLALCRYADTAYPRDRRARVAAMEVEVYGRIVSPSLYDN
jgi:hypothetical protein